MTMFMVVSVLTKLYSQVTVKLSTAYALHQVGFPGHWSVHPHPHPNQHVHVADSI